MVSVFAWVVIVVSSVVWLLAVFGFINWVLSWLNRDITSIDFYKHAQTDSWQDYRRKDAE